MYNDQHDTDTEDLVYEVKVGWAAEHAPELLDERGDAIDWDALCDAFDAFDWRAEIARDEDAAWESWGRCPACSEPIDYCQGHGPIGDPEGWAILQDAYGD